jgi:CRISPR-associated protein Cas1
MGPKRFVEELDKRLRTTIMHRSVGRKVSYRRLIRLEIYKIEKHIMGEKEYKPFVSQW